MSMDAKCTEKRSRSQELSSKLDSLAEELDQFNERLDSLGDTVCGSEPECDEEGRNPTNEPDSIMDRWLQMVERIQGRVVAAGLSLSRLERDFR